MSADVIHTLQLTSREIGALHLVLCANELGRVLDKVTTIRVGGALTRVRAKIIDLGVPPLQPGDPA
ncbi:hypothetical protein sos41_11640 [Alphaproteobacteria bacterium SO-S41]|nr:hypothetical protein sos41_11640 [Alphaproteobacteria bacterium SO-S41]